MISRRRFLVWVSSAVPIALVTRRADALAAAWIADDVATLRALAEAILPADLGRAGTVKVARDFQRWIDNYRENAELVHGYATSVLRFAPASPRAKWSAQLAELRRLITASPEARREMVRADIKDLRTDRMPAVGAAPHVALGLLAFYYQSSEATDLCYRAEIGRERCRPLSASRRAPLPLGGGRHETSP